MTGELRDLYQDVILDHYRRPRNSRAIEDPDRKAEGWNPLCGDRVTVTIALDGDTVAEIGVGGQGCAISTASASLMSEAVKGKRSEEVEAIFRGFHGLVTGGENGGGPDLGKLEVLAGVREFPIRVKCATLAWHTLRAALANRGGTVTTE